MLFPVLRLLVLVHVALAVLAETAFTREMVVHSVGALRSLRFLAHGHAVATTDAQVVLVSGLDAARVNWAVPLPHADAELYVAPNDATVYLYHEHTVDVRDAKLGVLRTTVHLPHPVRQVVPFFRNAVLVLDTAGQLHLLTPEGHRTAVDTPSARSVAFAHLNGAGWVVLDSKHVYEITELGEVGDHHDKSFDAIDHARGPWVALAAAVTNVATGHRTKTGARPQLVGDGSHAVVVRDGGASVVRCDSGAEVALVPVRGRAEVVQHHLSTYVIDVHGPRATVHDVTDALAVGDASAVKLTLVVLGADEALLGVLSAPSGPVLGAYAAGTLKMFSLETGITVATGELPMFRGHQWVLIDGPVSNATLERAHDLADDAHAGLVVMRWAHRTKRHLAEVGRAAVAAARGRWPQVTPVDPGVAKLVVFWDESAQAVTAVASDSGAVVWRVAMPRCEVFASGGGVIAVAPDRVVKIDAHGSVGTDDTAKFDRSFGVDGGVVVVSRGSYRFVGTDATYVVDHDAHTVWGVDPELHRTWQWGPRGHRVVQVAGRAPGAGVPLVGIVNPDKTLLYRYLNANAVAVVSELAGQLHLHVLDGATGQLLFREAVAAQADPETVRVVVQDNFVVWTYFVTGPSAEQRVAVVDLFDGPKAEGSGQPVLEFAHNLAPELYLAKTWIYPEPIVAMAAGQSRYGITTRLVVAVLALGQVVELPKYVLNSRRVDSRAMNAGDAQLDFRMLPYEPVVAKNNFQVINHKLLVDPEGAQVLVRPLNYELTLVVCVASPKTLFCTTVQPLALFDLLSARFDRGKLVATIVVLLVAFVAVKPFVARKKLRFAWVDKA